MPLKKYGVLKGRPVATMAGKGENPHYQVLIKDKNGASYRLSINIKSKTYPSEVLYFISENFYWEEIEKLPDLPCGFTAIKNNQPATGLDYIRGDLIDRSKMIPLPAEANGSNNLNCKIQGLMKLAIRERAVLYAFGDHWGPEKKHIDPYFAFSPDNGIHDLHMNQGNVDDYKKDDGIWQDGGIFIHFKEVQKWVAIFLAFQSQCWHTDDHGHAVKDEKKADSESSVSRQDQPRL